MKHLTYFLITSISYIFSLFFINYLYFFFILFLNLKLISLNLILFYIIFSILISLYFFMLKKYYQLKDNILIYELFLEEKKFYHIHYLFLDLIYLLKINPITCLITLSLLILLIKIGLLKIIFLRSLISLVWSIHYFALILSNRSLNEEFKIEVNLEYYNYYWLKLKNILILYFFKITQLKGFLINYIIFSKKSKEARKWASIISIRCRIRWKLIIELNKRIWRNRSLRNINWSFRWKCKYYWK